MTVTEQAALGATSPLNVVNSEQDWSGIEMDGEIQSTDRKGGSKLGK